MELINRIGYPVAEEEQVDDLNEFLSEDMENEEDDEAEKDDEEEEKKEDDKETLDGSEEEF